MSAASLSIYADFMRRLASVMPVHDKGDLQEAALGNYE